MAARLPLGRRGRRRRGRRRRQGPGAEQAHVHPEIHRGRGRRPRAPRFGIPSPGGVKELSDIQLSWVNPDADALVEKLDANLVFGRSYANSYIAQKFRLPPAPGAPRRAVMVGIDTSQLNVLVGVLSMLAGESPGDKGRVLDGQAQIIESCVDEARRAGELVIFAGHHSWLQLDAGSRNRLAGIMERVDHPLVYLSAHTHEGWWAMHRIGGRSLLELNVSSLADWPIAYRRVAFAFDPEANRIKVSAELMPMLQSPPQSDSELLDAWVQQTCSEVDVPLERIARRDHATVVAQRVSRGTLVEWAFEGFEAVSDSARRMLYEHAHRYQDGLLDVIMSTYGDLGDQVPELADIAAPSFCVGGNVKSCAAALMGNPAGSLQESIDLYRKKAILVEKVGGQLDDVQDPRGQGLHGLPRGDRGQGRLRPDPGRQAPGHHRGAPPRPRFLPRGSHRGDGVTGSGA
ncbi:MAG: hypothetical protein MZU95_10955 [Desulfomicrobium escambiense]|nr:hypothetical protein [Desulfomicrobium escambiense]